MEHLDLSKFEGVNHDTQNSEGTASSNPDNPLFDKITADVEKLKSSMEANSELRQVYSEKFSRIDERIGELRNMLVDREKDISRIELAAIKASDLVAEVQPEALMVEVKREDAKVEEVKDKLESFHELINIVMKELKDLHRVKIFRGIDSVKESVTQMHSEVERYHSDIKKVKEIIETFL